MIMKIDLSQAIKAINPSAEFTYSNEDFSTIQWIGGTSPISQSDVEAKQTELQAESDALEYSRNRAEAYPPLGDQLDMMWHDNKDTTTTWEDAVQAVKDAHPKP